MSAMLAALKKLDDAIAYLEISVDDMEKKSSAVIAGQADMFSAAPQTQNNNAVAQRLDQAIQKVEKILQEA